MQLLLLQSLSWDVGLATSWEKDVGKTSARARKNSSTGTFSLSIRALKRAYSARIPLAEMQDNGWFLSTAEKAFQEVKGEARKVLIANKTPIWNSELSSNLKRLLWETVNSPAVNSQRSRQVVFLNDPVFSNTLCWAQHRRWLEIELLIMHMRWNQVK